MFLLSYNSGEKGWVESLLLGLYFYICASFNTFCNCIGFMPVGKLENIRFALGMLRLLEMQSFDWKLCH